MGLFHIVFVLIAACAAAFGASAQESPAPERAKIVLLDPGNDDRQLLRWQPATDEPTRVRMTMDMSMSLIYDGTRMPASSLPIFAFDMVIEAEEPDEDGVYSVRTVYERVGLEGDVDAAVGEALLTALGPLEGTEILFTMDTRGALRSLDLSSVPREVLQMLGGEKGARHMIESFGNPLPEEPVGLGARWEVTQQVRTPNAPVLQSRTVYELAGREGERLELKLTGTQTGAEQEFETGVAGLNATLKRASGAFAGTAVLRLDRLAPVQAVNEGHLEFRFIFTERGRTQEMEQSVRVRVEIQEVAPEQP